jgi:hypothetical protein
MLKNICKNYCTTCKHPRAFPAKYPPPTTTPACTPYLISGLVEESLRKFGTITKLAALRAPVRIRGAFFKKSNPPIARAGFL